MTRLLLLMVLTSLMAFALPGIPPKVVQGDCSSSDNSKKFKQKIYIDANQDGKYDHVQTTYCNGKTRTNKIKNLTEYAPDDYPVDGRYRHDISFPATGGIKHRFEIVDTVTNFVVAQETVYDSVPDTVYVSFFDPLSPLRSSTGNRVYDIQIEKIEKTYSKEKYEVAKENEVGLADTYLQGGKAVIEVIVTEAGRYKLDLHTNQSGFMEDYEYDFKVPGAYKITIANSLLDLSSQWADQPDIKKVTLNITRTGEKAFMETIEFKR